MNIQKLSMPKWFVNEEKEKYGEWLNNVSMVKKNSKSVPENFSETYYKQR